MPNRARTSVNIAPSQFLVVVISVALAATFSGFLAWSVGKIPLVIIVVFTLILMVIAQVDDLRRNGVTKPPEGRR